MEGTTLDKYEILEKVGEGGMASVYRGRHRTLGREVAIKVLHPHLGAMERNRLRFEREARATEALRHENILEIFDYSGKESEHCYIITEFVHGVTLRTVLAQRSLPSEITAIIGVSLCRALDYAHEKGIVHRDLKPENVMLRPDGHVKLMDFGIARVLDDSKVTVTGGLVGSPAYMSPEQASDGEVGPRSDIFSLGILLYRCVTGHLPFEGNNPPTILRNILEGNYAPPEDVCPAIEPLLADIIKRALARDPAQRFPTARAMGAALTGVLEYTGVPVDEGQIKRYFDDPASWEDKNLAHLRVHLMGRARAELARKDTAAAMRVLNRLLYLSEDNAEVMALLQGLHQEPRRLPRWLLAAVLLVVIPLLAALVLLAQSGYFDEQAPSPSRASPGALGLDDDPDRWAQDPLAELQREDPTPEITPGPVAAPPVAAEQAARPAPAQKAPPRPRPAQVSPGTLTPAAPQPGVLDLQSSPWAQIYVDGSPRSAAGVEYGTTLRPRPVSLSPGTYRIKLVNPSCAPVEETLTLKPGDIIKKRYTLCSRLILTGMENGWEVRLNDKVVGIWPNVTQPLLLSEPPAEHSVEIKRVNGSRFRQTVRSGSGVITVNVPGEGS